MLAIIAAVTMATASSDVAISTRQIYLQAREAINSIPIPKYVVFTYSDFSKNEFLGREVYAHERLRVAVRTSDGHAFVETLQTRSGFQGRMPPVVVGDNGIFPNTSVYRLGDFPTADFGLRTGGSRTGIFETDSMLGPPPSPLRVIGTVTVVDIPYRLTRLADSTVQGRAVYHLALAPIRDPRHNVLRELWVDKQTFEPTGYVVERFVGSPTLFSYLVHVSNERIGNYVVNSELTGQFSTQLLGHRGPPGKIDPLPSIRNADVAWSITEISFPDELPDWLFDPDHFALHKNDELPSVLKVTANETALPSLRHLVFAIVTTSVHDGSNVSVTNAQLVLEVVAATADDGLVVDVKQMPDETSSHRVAITLDGELLFGSDVELSQGEKLVLSLLGRAVIGPAARSAGDSWDIPAGGSYRGWSFHVLETPTARSEVLDATREQGQLHGTVTYNPALSVPIVATFSAAAPTDSDSVAPLKIRLQLLEDSYSGRQ
jgi:hypothetical protein